MWLDKGLLCQAALKIDYAGDNGGATKIPIQSPAKQQKLMRVLIK